ncbi:protection of telomeres protein 1 isoform X3 [Gasterosteus aculeatus]
MRITSPCQFETKRGKTNRDAMPRRVMLQGAGPGDKVPAHLTSVPVSLIGTDTDCSDKTVKGKVVRKGPLVSLASHSFILKAVIQEEDSSQSASINVVLIGELAEEFSRAVNQGDVVVVSGFSVGRSPTVHKDGLHPFNLLLSGDTACVYVSPPPPPAPDDPSTSMANQRSSALPAQVSRMTEAPKYSRLGDLKAGSVVNVYGVVVFFKQPFMSRGTDLCSTLKITDQSDQKIACTVFSKKLEDHPQIFGVGDIVRLHNVKVTDFKNSVTLMNTFRFSVLAFDGAEGDPLEPRTSSRSFHLDQEDRRTVEELRTWAASQGLLLPTTPLCAAQPKDYFDLTCQLLAKAPMDTTCTLLRVWDGTRCAHTQLKVIVEPSVVDGPTSFSAARERLIADVLVYDNHVESARQLKPGDFLRIYNLRAIPMSSKAPPPASCRSEEGGRDHLGFHLHGGTAFSRGIRVLPENSPAVRELKRVMEAVPQEDGDDFSEMNDSLLLEVWSTPPQSPEAEAMEVSTGVCVSERSCAHDVGPLSLSEVKRLHPGGVHHVRVQLRSYEPVRLHQALKLYCSKCSSMQDVPDDELVASLFSEASKDPEPCCPPPWALSGQVLVPGESVASPGRSLSVLLSTDFLCEDTKRELIFLAGATLEETCQLAAGYQHVVPVRSSGGHMTLLDLSAPFLLRGRKRSYGCKRCSEAAVREPAFVEGAERIDEKLIAEALGVEPLQFVLLMKMKLQDATGVLDVFLWRGAESFFGVAAEDVAANQEAQDGIRQLMAFLCPAGGSTAQRPWMDLCLTAYQGEDDEGRPQTCYQIHHSTVTRPASTHSNPA